jgi:checkpoint serine/threonine-protein kinase
MEPKPWAGETLKAGGKKSSGPKMAVFRDAVSCILVFRHNRMLIHIGLMYGGLAHHVSQSLSKQLSQSHIPIHHNKVQVTVNPASGKRERVFVDLRAVYPTPNDPGTELSFEEIWAANRGWLGHQWDDEEPRSFVDENSMAEVNALADRVSQKLVVHHDVLRLDENGAPIFPKASKPRKKKAVEVNETQISKPTPTPTCTCI